VTVQDTQPPVITPANVPPLWPPNRDEIVLDIAQCIESATDVCEGDVSSSATILCATSDEPDAVIPGDPPGDIVILDGQHVQLRSQRIGGLNGRVYRISFQVTDSSGNVTTASCRVDVPHDNADDSAVEDPPAYEVCL
jgi:hypothetical protein